MTDQDILLEQQRLIMKTREALLQTVASRLYGYQYRPHRPYPGAVSSGEWDRKVDNNKRALELAEKKLQELGI